MRRLVVLAFAGLLSGCYAPPQPYPTSWPQPMATSRDPCQALAGTYRSRGDTSDSERLPNVTPDLFDDLFGSSRSGPIVDRIRLRLGTFDDLTIEALSGTDIVQAAVVPAMPSDQGCLLSSPKIVRRQLSLTKAADGSLVVHIAKQSMLYMLVPRQYNEPRWTRFEPAN